MAIRSNDARRASTKNQSEPVDPICSVISVHSEVTSDGNQPNASRSTNLPDACSTSSDNSIASRRHRARRHARRLLSCALTAGALGLFLSGVPGCTTTSGIAGSIGDGHCIEDFMIGYRNRALAEKAWHCQKNQFCNQQNSKEFKAGFIAGFLEVAEGGNGCVPAIAPKQYWGWRYQSASGQCAVNSWFEGYTMGVRAAEKAGVGNWSQVATAGRHNPVPQPAVPVGGTNPFYGAPAVDEAMEGDIEMMPELQAPSMESGFDEMVPVQPEIIEDVIDLNFDSTSTKAAPQVDGFGDEPIFDVLVDADVTSDARIAELGIESEDSGISVDVDEVFGNAVQDDSTFDDSLPFSFE